MPTNTLKILRDVLRVKLTGPLPIVTPQRQGGRHLLVEVCAAMECRQGIEVGVRSGAFSALFLKAIPGLEMWCIDPWSPVPNYSPERQARHYAEAVQALSPYKAHLIKKFSHDAVEDAPAGVDFLHIDGGHDFDDVCRDLIHYCPKVRSGGLIMAHDYHLAGVKHAIDAYTAAHHIDPWFTQKNIQPTALWVQP
jgi:hypothetical protein